MTKTCPKCKEEKEYSLFHKSSKMKDGVQSWCKSCAKDARMITYYKNPSVQRETERRLVKRNRQYIYDYLLSHPCVDCNESDPVVLTFDHVRGVKNFNIGDALSSAKSIKTLQNEIDLCEVRCANCHARKTARENNWYSTIEISLPG